MKSIQIFFVFVLLNTACLLASAQNPVISKGKDHITFKVNSVEYSKTPFEKVPYREALEHRLGSAVEGMPASMFNDSLIPVGVNGFVAAVHLAYARHYPLIIRPDMIWLVICQGLAEHINAHSDSLRPMIVDHSDKIKLTFIRPDFTKGNIHNPWDNVFPELCDSVQNYLKTDFTSQFNHSFSTTGPIEKAAFELTMLDCMKTYFDYEGFIACGIPEITLEGKPEDWQWIRDHAEFLRTYGLDVWVDAMNPVLDEFVNASKGKVNLLFWQSFYAWVQSCGAHMTGWICALFPYSIDGYYNERVLSYPPAYREFSPDYLPSGLSKIPVSIIPFANDSFKMEFSAGFMGIRQDPKTLAVRPEISWAVREPLIIQPTVRNENDSAAMADPGEYSMIITEADHYNTLLDTLRPLITVDEYIIYLSTLDGQYLPLTDFQKERGAMDSTIYTLWKIDPPMVKIGRVKDLSKHEEDISKWVNKKIKHSKEKGDVKVSFRIDRMCQISFVNIIETFNPALNDEIIAAIKSLKVVSPILVQEHPISCLVETTLHIR